MNYKVPINGEWVQFSDQTLSQLREKGCGRDADALVARVAEQHQNPLAYFLPHGIPWSDKTRSMANGKFVIPPSHYPKKYKNDGVAFLSDRTHAISLMLGPNQNGKTNIGATWSDLRLVPTEKWWPIFSEHGVEWYPWDGPKIWVVASYSWDNVATVWSRYQETLPREELGKYASDWGNFDGEEGAKKSLSFGDGRTKTCHLKCGSQIKFRCYTQQQIHWEGFESDGQHADEQEPMEKLTGWQRGATTRDDYTPCCMTLTGHVMDDRPDTGAAGPIKREIYDPIAENGVGYTKYGTAAVYHLSVDSTPEAIISKKHRHDLDVRWVNDVDDEGNTIIRSEKDERAAVARYWGGWEEGSGLYFDTEVWQRKVHMIQPRWDDDKTPKPDKATLYRVIDFGDTGITVCSWWAVMWDYAFLYRVLYEKNIIVAQAARKIIEMSHNTQVKLYEERDPLTGNGLTYFEERVNPSSGETVFRTILDGRSFSQRQQGETIGSLFERYGVATEQSDGKANVKQLPLLKDWMQIDLTKVHPCNKEADGTPVIGCSKVFFFDGVAGMVEAVDEIEHFPEDALAQKKAPDHFIDTAKYWASHGPEFWGDYRDNAKTEDEDSEEDNTPFTGA